MTILFDKINSTPKSISLASNNIILDGSLTKSGYHKVSLNANLKGDMNLSCDRCGDTYIYDFDTKLNLTLTDLISEDKSDLDIIEFLDNKIDIKYILDGEINRVKTSFHYCKKCENIDESFEMEF